MKPLIEMENYDAVDRAIARLQKQGYAGQFELRFDALIDPSDERYYHANDFDIDEMHRFEQAETKGKLSFVLAIRTIDDRRGLVVDAYGKNANPISIEMLDKIQLENLSRKP